MKFGSEKGEWIALETGMNGPFFCISKKNAREKRFFLNLPQFTIEVIDTFEEMPDELLNTPKLFLVLKPQAPYYYHCQKERVLTNENITEDEKEYIQAFENGLGYIYDYKECVVVRK